MTVFVDEFAPEWTRRHNQIQQEIQGMILWNSDAIALNVVCKPLGILPAPEKMHANFMQEDLESHRNELENSRAEAEHLRGVVADVNSQAKRALRDAKSYESAFLNLVGRVSFCAL